MRLREYMNTDVINTLTDWYIQKQLSLTEVFDSNININTNSDCDSYNSIIHIDNKKYRFLGINNKGIYDILFYLIDSIDDPFKLRNNKLYIGKVFAGVFRSLRSMIKDCNVKGFKFSSDNNNLEKLYTRMIPWIHKRFKTYSLDKIYTGNKGNKVFVYMKNGNITEDKGYHET